MHWEEAAAEKRRKQQASIPSEWLSQLPSPNSIFITDATQVAKSSGFLSTKELEITDAPVKILLQRIASRRWTAVEVTTAFLKRAVLAQIYTNCLTEILVERALQRASHLDQYLKKEGKVVGPLHGLPISLKDQINVKGVETTMGYISLIGNVAERSSAIVDILEASGANPIVKTNNPQTLMWVETHNLLFGRTLNPHNRELTCGGSSGGEGALLGMRGSAIGVGTDIGGSIRVPAGFCGAYGLKPSIGRLPFAGISNTSEGQEAILTVAGPLSQSLFGIKIFMQAVLAQNPWLTDPTTIRKPWNEDEYLLLDRRRGKSLCFAILWDDEVTRPHPPITRALKTTKAALESAGHRVLDWHPLKHEEIYDVTRTIWASGSAEDFARALEASGEPWMTSMRPEHGPSDRLPPRESDSMSAYQLFQVHKQRKALREEYLQQWNSTERSTGTGRPVDAIITPLAPCAPAPHGRNRNADYTLVWNCLDYPSLVLPVTKVDPSLDKKVTPHEFRSSYDKVNYEMYDPETFDNAPVAVQLVARTLEEEALIGMGEIVENALNAPPNAKL